MSSPARTPLPDANPRAARLAGRDVQAFLTEFLEPAELTTSGRAVVARLDRAAARFVTGEQSNASVIVPLVGEPGGVIVKALREPVPGVHPDVEVPAALWRIGWRHVPELLGVTTSAAGAVRAIVSTYLANAEDGFELACHHAREGLPFAEAMALGHTVRGMHDALLRAFAPSGTTAVSTDGSPALLARRLRDRAAWALGQVADLAPYRDGINRLLSELAALPTVPVPQRIHGDLHLGQTLHRSDGWFILDFEGEPLVPLADRCRPDHPERDLAGMLRSIDYAAAVGLAPDGWREQTATDFLAGYGPGSDPASMLLLRSFTLDKALYECVYEQQNRHEWLTIPLSAVAALVRG